MPDRGKVTGKRLISCMLSIAGLLGILLLSGCRSTPPEPPPPAAQWFDTGTFRVEVVDASLPRDVRSTGCRFLLAGWVRSLIPQGADTIEACDTVIVFSLPEALHEVEELLTKVEGEN